MAGIVTLLACFSAVSAMSMSTLQDLEKLISDYESESEASAEQNAATSRQIPDIPGIPRHIPNAEECSSSCRRAYHTCLERFTEEEEQQMCADLFVRCFPRCFYGAENKGHPDISVCQPLCLRQYDSCIDYSQNKPEIFVCRNGRRRCRDNCHDPEVKKSMSTVSKRSDLEACKTGCSGSWDLCWRSIQDNFTEMLICRAARNTCDDGCDSKHGQ